MANSFPDPDPVAEVTAVQVGNFFVGQYYQVLQKQPDYVHHFYTDQSSMVRIDGAAIKSATGTMEIHSLIMSLSFTSIEIKTAHSMESWNGGVLVMVSGSVQIKEFNGRKNFAQIFFLAPQEKGFFVLNDIFQFFEESPLIQHPATVMDHGNYVSNLNVPSYDSNLNASPFDPHLDVPSNLETGNEYDLETDVQGDEYVSMVPPQETEAIDKYSIPEPTPEIPETEIIIPEEITAEESSPSYTSSLPVNSTRDSLPLSVDEPREATVKHTYASILRSKGNPMPSSHVSLPKINDAAVNSEWDQPLPQPPQPAPVQYHSQQTSMPEKYNVGTDDFSALDDEGEVTSVYVRNLPSDASASELEQEFRNFGRLKAEGVLIKSRKEAGVYYAFVEFEDISGVQNAVKASPIQYHGRQIYVEERRPNSGASRGRRGRGRGGYPFEGSRGGRGFGARTYGRGVGQDNARDYSRARGNGIHQRASSRPERGILGSQGTRNGQHQYDVSS